MLRRERVEFAGDFEKAADEVIQIGRDFDDECRTLFRRDSGRVLARGEDPQPQVGSGFAEVFEKGFVEAYEALAIIEIVETKAKGKRKGALRPRFRLSDHVTMLRPGRASV